MVTKKSNSEFKYIKFNKPYGVLCSFTDQEGRGTLSSYINLPDVYAAGRLDMDSEGLLFLTNDGNMNHRITSPKFHLPKTYLVQVEGIPGDKQLAEISNGVVIKNNYHTKRCQVMQIEEPLLPVREKPVTPHGPTAWLRIVLKEGKKRQVRQMTAAVGLPTLRLYRVAIGPIFIGDLEPGQWMDLSEAEVKQLRNKLSL